MRSTAGRCCSGALNRMSKHIRGCVHAHVSAHTLARATCILGKHRAPRQCTQAQGAPAMHASTGRPSNARKHRAPRQCTQAQGAPAMHAGTGRHGNARKHRAPWQCTQAQGAPAMAGLQETRRPSLHRAQQRKWHAHTLTLSTLAAPGSASAALLPMPMYCDEIQAARPSRPDSEPLTGWGAACTCAGQAGGGSGV